jgi:hypothetical protein
MVMTTGAFSSLPRPLCRGYDREEQAVSISYAAIRIFGPRARDMGCSRHGLTVEIEHGSLSYQR